MSRINPLRRSRRRPLARYWWRDHLEKATRIGEKLNQVMFKVLRDATKPEIKAAVELMFKVEVAAVTSRCKRQGQALRAFHRPPRSRQEGVVALKAPGAQFLRGGS